MDLTVPLFIEQGDYGTKDMKHLFLPNISGTSSIKHFIIYVQAGPVRQPDERDGSSPFKHPLITYCMRRYTECLLVHVYLTIRLLTLNFYQVVVQSPLDICLTNRFYFDLCLFSYRRTETSQCGKNKKVAHEPTLSVSLMFLPRCDVLCAYITEQTTGKWNLFVLYNKYIKNTFQKIY